MNKEKNKIPTTIILSFLYDRIKKKNKGPYIKTKLLKEIIKRHFVYDKIVRDGSDIKNTKGINKIHIYSIIEDMINFNLIKRLNHGNYEILNTNNQDVIIKSIQNKVKYLKRLENKKKNISEQKFILLNEELDNIIELVDDNSKFQILKSDCKKRLGHFPFN